MFYEQRRYLKLRYFLEEKIEFFGENEGLSEGFSPFEKATSAFMSVLCIAGGFHMATLKNLSTEPSIEVNSIHCSFINH
jgi:hypothetical protein